MSSKDTQHICSALLSPETGLSRIIPELLQQANRFISKFSAHRPGKKLCLVVAPLPAAPSFSGNTANIQYIVSHSVPIW